MVAVISNAMDCCNSEQSHSPRSPLSLKALRVLGANGRVAAASPRSKVRFGGKTASSRPRAPKPSVAWSGDEALWLSDDFLFPVDRHKLGEASARFPPEFNEAPPDRCFVSHRTAVTKLEQRGDEESSRLFAHVPIATADLSELPRRRRIQLLGGLLSEEKEVLPRHRREAEVAPMRHVNARRARCEFAVRWGRQRWPRYLPIGEVDEGDDVVLEEPAGLSWPSFEVLLPGAPRREVFAEREKSKPTELSQALLKYRQRREADALAPTPRLPAKGEDEEEPPSGESFEAVLKELRRLTSESAETSLSASQCRRMADCGRQLEVQSYKLRFAQLLEALVAVAAAAARVEVAAQPRVTDRLIVKEHWRRKHQDLRTSANSMAEAVCAQTLTANLASVIDALKALAESSTGCQERLDAQLARLKERFGQERLSPGASAAIAGAIGQMLLPGPHGSGRGGVHARNGATPESKCFNVRFMKDFAEMVMEAVPDFAEAEFEMIGWIFPTAYLDEGQMRQLLARAAEIQVGLRPLPGCDACRKNLGHVVDFVRAKMPKLNAKLSEFVQSYCDSIKRA